MIRTERLNQLAAGRLGSKHWTVTPAVSKRARIVDPASDQDFRCSAVLGAFDTFLTRVKREYCTVLVLLTKTFSCFKSNRLSH